MMQRRNLSGETTKNPRLSTGSTRSFRSRRSQSSISSISDVFACEATSEGHIDLSVSEMKLRSEKNLDGGEGRNAEAGAMKMTPTEPFEEGEQRLIRPDRHHQKDPQEPGDDLEWEGVEKPRRNSERSETDSGEEPFFSKEQPDRRPRAIIGERDSPL